MSDRRATRRRGRIALAAVVLAAWVGGLGTLVFREYLDPDRAHLADAGARVEPGAIFFSALQGGRQIGYGSSTVDTTALEVQLSEVLRVELPVGGREQTAEARTLARFSRSLSLVGFSLVLSAETGRIRTTGEWESDSVFRFIVRTGRERPDTQRVAATAPLYYPGSVPMVLALSAPPVVGRAMSLRVADPVGLTVRQARVRFTAETLFVVNDSAVYDAATKQWAEARPDTVRAWKLDPGDERTLVSGWVDRQGRVIDATHLGTVRLERRPYEVAVENWRQRRLQGADTVTADRDILETTAISASRTIAREPATLSFRLGGTPLDDFDLDAPRQRFADGTLHVRREPAEWLVAEYRLPAGAAARHPDETAPEPLVESTDSAVVTTARRIVAGETDPARAAHRLNEWVHRSLRKRVTFGIPSARQVLRARSGDCNEHTQLYVALARAVGIPARVAAGLVHIDGKFYYHAWPEIWLRDWVAVDPTLGQFPADAAHLRFVSGGLDRQAELLGLIGRLTIDILD